MGIDGFGSFLRKLAPRVFVPKRLREYAGASMAFDMHQYVYRMFHAGKTDADAWVPDFVARLVQYNIRPVFVFDGPTRGLKPRAHAKRKQDHEKQCQVIADLQTVLATTRQVSEIPVVEVPVVEIPVVEIPVVEIPVPEVPVVEVPVPEVPVPEIPVVEVPVVEVPVVEIPVVEVPVPHPDVDADELAAEIEKRLQRVARPSAELFAAVQHALRESFGEPSVVQAPDDAERLVATMCRDGAVQFAVSTDYDTLVFGSPNLIINFGDSRMEELNLDAVLRELQLTPAQFVDLALLSGCDVCEKVPSIGPITARKLLLKYGSIENMFVPELVRRLKGQEFDFEFGRRRFRGE